IGPQIFRVGDFKSAVEPFLREDMSDENRLQVSSYLNAINDNIIENVASSRDIALVTLKEISDEMKVRSAKDAVDYGLVDALYYKDEFLATLREQLDIESTDDIESISYDDYKKSFSTYKKSSNQIAVIVAEGEIVRGEAEQGMIGGEKFARELRKARENDKVKAVVVRINSPGGDFIASDMMWREVQLTAMEKPIIASMSDYAASGGYYMAMACDTIFAQPNTITGSIGIFGMIFNMEKLMNDKLGITTDPVNTGEYSGMMTMSRPLTSQEKNIIQKQLERGYDTFTSKAAEGRKMPIEELLKVASGRVWTGEQAFENGLVDVMGGLDDAIAHAAEKAGVGEDYKLRFYPKYQPLIERLMNTKQEIRTSLVKQELGEMYSYLKEIKKINRYNGIQTRMPYEIRFE
ncbi:MAG: signal peptide peptidase SppA, partial [Cyclobacteriaceae bacterium]|nr:signal peptide peptidase SppA [Cyclobacteriaceae bacterium]